MAGEGLRAAFAFPLEPKPAHRTEETRCLVFSGIKQESPPGPAGGWSSPPFPARSAENKGRKGMSTT